MSVGGIDLVLEWKDPPPTRKGVGLVRAERRTNYDWLAHLIQLRDRPGEWAEVARCFSNGPLSAMQNAIRAGKNQRKVWASTGPWEAVTRFRPEDGYASLYVRWVGTKEEAAR